MLGRILLHLNNNESEDVMMARKQLLERREGTPKQMAGLARALMHGPDDCDLLALNSVKLGREDNSVEINGPTDCSCLVIVMLSDSGHVVLNPGGETELRNFLNRRQSRVVRARRRESKQR